MKSFFLRLLVLYVLLCSLWAFPYVQKAYVNKGIQASGVVQGETMVTGSPKKIAIPRLSVDLQVEDGDYTKEVWTSSANKALFAKVSALPNNTTGNTVIYGHNTNNVFYPTQRLINGDLALVYTDNGVFVYRFINSELVDPTNTSVFMYQGKSRLTLITCHGLANEKRRLMYFEFVELKKA
jgi:LPXTG-site transpeptidase (sortase) family protein